MKIAINSSSTLKAVSSVKEYTGVETVYLDVSKEGISLIGSGNDTTIQCFIESENLDKKKKSYRIGINIDILTGICRGRKSLLIENSTKDKSSLFFQSETSAYSGEFKIIPSEDIKIQVPNEGLELSQSTRDAVEEALDRISISDVFTDNPMYVCMVADKQGLQATCFDRLHVAYYKNPEVKGDFQFTLPYSVFNGLSRLSDGRPYKLLVKDTQVVAYNKDFFVQLPVIQADNKYNMEMVKQLAEKLPKNPASTVTAKLEDLIMLLDNASSIYEEGGYIEVSKVNKQVQLSSTTSYGKIQEVLDSEVGNWDKKQKYRLSPNLVSDILSPYPNDLITLNFTDKFMFIKENIADKNLLYICQLIG